MQNGDHKNKATSSSRHVNLGQVMLAQGFFLLRTGCHDIQHSPSRLTASLFTSQKVDEPVKQ